MEPKNKKGTLICIIVLLAIFLPLSILGTVAHFSSVEKKESTPAPDQAPDNPNHEFRFQGRLYFYERDTLLGTYVCEHAEYCSYAKETYDDVSYAIASHAVEEDATVPVIDGRYVFLTDAATEDTDEVILYDLQTSKTVTRYQAVKNYGIGTEGHYVFVKNNLGKWGIIQLQKSGHRVALPFEYDFIGLLDDVNEEGVLKADSLVVSNHNLWSIIGIDGIAKLKDYKATIVSFTDTMVISKEDNLYYVTDYQGTRILPDGYTSLSFTGNYINVIDTNNQFYVCDSTTRVLISNMYPKAEGDIFTSRVEGQKLIIIKNGMTEAEIPL